MRNRVRLRPTANCDWAAAERFEHSKCWSADIAGGLVRVRAGAEWVCTGSCLRALDWSSRANDRGRALGVAAPNFAAYLCQGAVSPLFSSSGCNMSCVS